MQKLQKAGIFLSLALALASVVQASAAQFATLHVGIQRDNPNQNVFTSYESIRFAQITLRDRGYYTGQINGVMTPATRNAIREFQREANLPITGDLDQRTSRELGIANEAGSEGAPIEIVNARAERLRNDSIRINLDIRTQGSGWQVFV